MRWVDGARGGWEGPNSKEGSEITAKGYSQEGLMQGCNLSWINFFIIEVQCSLG